MILFVMIIVIGFIMWLLNRQGGNQLPPLELKYAQLVNLLLEKLNSSVLESSSNLLKTRGYYKGAQVELILSETNESMLRVVYMIKSGPYYSGLNHGLDFELDTNLFTQERCLFNFSIVSIFLNYEIEKK